MSRLDTVEMLRRVRQVLIGERRFSGFSGPSLMLRYVLGITTDLDDEAFRHEVEVMLSLEEDAIAEHVDVPAPAAIVLRPRVDREPPKECRICGRRSRVDDGHFLLPDDGRVDPRSKLCPSCHSTRREFARDILRGMLADPTYRKVDKTMRSFPTTAFALAEEALKEELKEVE